MKFSKIVLPSMLIAGALAVGSIGVDRVLARSEDNSNYPSIVIRISEKFNLNKDDVLEVFEEEHAEKHAVMLQNFQERLDKAVDEGKITSEQKDLVLDKHEEMYAKMDELKSKNLSKEQLREEMKKIHEELRSWANQNGINFPFMIYQGNRSKEGQRMGFGSLN